MILTEFVFRALSITFNCLNNENVSLLLNFYSRTKFLLQSWPVPYVRHLYYINDFLQITTDTDIRFQSSFRISTSGITDFNAQKVCLNNFADTDFYKF